MGMDGILLLLTESDNTYEMDDLLQMAGQLKPDKPTEVIEMAVLDDSGQNISDAVLSCVKKGVDHLIVVPFVREEVFPLLEIEELVREEALSFRGMTVQFAEPVKVRVCERQAVEKPSVPDPTINDKTRDTTEYRWDDSKLETGEEEVN